MTVVGDLHDAHGATYDERGGRRVVRHYGRPDSAHRAVRNGVGVIEMGYGVVVVEGDDRVEFVDDAVTNAVPTADGSGVYALLLDPQGAIRTDMYVYNAGERLLLFTPPARAADLADEWRENVFIRDVTIRDASSDFGVFGLHGPYSTEKLASVLNGAGAPEGHLSFVRGSIADIGVTAIAADGLTGEEGYEVVCTAADAADVFDALLTYGNPAAPFGYDSWDSLTLEAGTPLFESELDGRLPNVLGLRNALDFEKGCYVGQEVVSKVENRGRPSKRLVGVRLHGDDGDGDDDDDGDGSESLPPAGASVVAGGDEIGAVTRAARGPSVDAPLAFALVDFDSDADAVTVRVDGADVSASVEPLPFVEGSDRSARVPTYPE